MTFRTLKNENINIVDLTLLLSESRSFHNSMIFLFNSSPFKSEYVSARNDCLEFTHRLKAERGRLGFPLGWGFEGSEGLGVLYLTAGGGTSSGCNLYHSVISAAYFSTASAYLSSHS